MMRRKRNTSRSLRSQRDGQNTPPEADAAENPRRNQPLSKADITEIISELEREMMEAAEALEFERAAELRDKIRQIEKGELKLC